MTTMDFEPATKKHSNYCFGFSYIMWQKVVVVYNLHVHIKEQQYNFKTKLQKHHWYSLGPVKKKSKLHQKKKLKTNKNVSTILFLIPLKTIFRCKHFC